MLPREEERKVWGKPGGRGLVLQALRVRAATPSPARPHPRRPGRDVLADAPSFVAVTMCLYRSDHSDLRQATAFERPVVV